MSTPLLQVRDLKKRFGGLQALNGVSFDVNRGNVMCVVGPNGSGKSTAFNIVSGILTADAGEVLFRGQRITDLPPHKIQRHGITRTFQDATLFPTLTLLENVEMALYGGSRTSILDAVLALPVVRHERKQARERAEALLAGIGGGQLYPRRFDYPYSCSLGEQRILEIANALASDPELILMDEPTQGLNPEWIGQVLELIEELSERDKTILFIEHKMSVVMKI